MTSHTASSQTSVALIASADEWSARALESVLQPAGYRVVRVTTGGEAEERARSVGPDAILIADLLPDRSGIELCRALRQDRAVTPGGPIIGLAHGALTRDLRLAWLRAGAWDVFGFPLDLEELLLKLSGYLGATERARAGILADPVTGLYNARGLERRARELLAEAVRTHAALACAVFGPASRPEDRDADPGRAGLAAVRGRLGSALRAHARLSDTIGWWNRGEFAVLAPATDAAGAAQLAERLTRAIETAPPERGAPVPALDLRVGYEALADVHATPVAAQDLLARATAALELARTGERGAHIRRFDPGR